MKKMWSDGEIAVWWIVTLLSWSALLWVLFRYKRYNELALGLFRFAIEVIFLACTFHEGCIGPEYLTFRLREQIQGQWVSMAVQLLSLPMAAVWRFVSFVFVETCLTAVRAVLQGSFYELALEFCIVMVALLLNWSLAAQRLYIPWREPLFWGPPVMLSFGQFSSLFIFQFDQILAFGLWRLVFNLSLLLSFLERDQWTEVYSRSVSRESSQRSPMVSLPSTPRLPEPSTEVTVYIGRLSLDPQRFSLLEDD